MSFPEVSHVRFLMRQQCANALSDNNILFSLFFFPTGFFDRVFYEARVCRGISQRESVVKLIM